MTGMCNVEKALVVGIATGHRKLRPEADSRAAMRLQMLTDSVGALQGPNALTAQGVRPVRDPKVEALFAAVTKGVGLM